MTNAERDNILISMSSQLIAVSEKLDNHDKIFETMNAKIGKLDQRMDKLDQRMDKLNQRMENLEILEENDSNQISKLFELVSEIIYKENPKINKRLDKHEKEIENLKAKLA